MMEVLDIDEPIKSKVLNVVKEMRFAGIETKAAMTIEGKIVQDANFLDNFGAIGVAGKLLPAGSTAALFMIPTLPCAPNFPPASINSTKEKVQY